MDCRIFAEKMYEYHYQLLEKNETIEMDRHMHSCYTCQTVFIRHKKGLALLNDWQVVCDNKDLLEQTSMRICATPVSGNWMFGKWMSTAAMFLLCTILGIALVKQQQKMSSYVEREKNIPQDSYRQRRQAPLRLKSMKKDQNIAITEAPESAPISSDIKELAPPKPSLMLPMCNAVSKKVSTAKGQSLEVVGKAAKHNEQHQVQVLKSNNKKLAMRLQQLLAQFVYQYPSANLGVQAQIMACPWNTRHLLLHIVKSSNSPRLQLRLVFNPKQVSAYRRLTGEQDKNNALYEIIPRIAQMQNYRAKLQAPAKIHKQNWLTIRMYPLTRDNKEHNFATLSITKSEKIDGDQWAAIIAGFAMLSHGEAKISTLTYAQLIALAQKANVGAPNAKRSQFIQRMHQFAKEGND